MNILNRSFSLAKEISRDHLTISLKKDYENIKNELKYDWSLLYKAAKGEHGYLKIPLGLEILKYNTSNENQYISNASKKIIECKEVNDFSNNMYKFKTLIDSLIYSISSPHLLEDNVLFKSEDIEREYRKFYSDFLRLGLVQRLISYKSYPNIENGIQKVDKIYKEINNNYFWEEQVTKRINDVSTNIEEKKIITISNIFYSILKLIEQIIYETHFNKITFINRKDIDIYNTNEGVVSKFELEITKDIEIQEGWIIYLEDKGSKDILLISNKSYSFVPNYKVNIKGYIYPRDDFKFINRFIDNIR